jgi:NAD(P)H-hydrate epimerase
MVLNSSNIPASVILKGSRIAEIDERCISSGTDSKWLMQNAGSCVADAIIRDLSEPAGLKIRDRVSGVVICGSGNNGGDGFVSAIDLIKKGISLKIFYINPVEKFTKDTLHYYEKLVSLNGVKTGKISVTFLDINDRTGRDDFINSLKNCNFVVDAIFGTGLHEKHIYGGAQEIIKTVNRICGKENDEADGQQPDIKNSARPSGCGKNQVKGTYPLIYSIDIPSGIDSDNGRVLGDAIRASKTITFGCKKLGIAVYPGREFAGDVEVADIGISQELYFGYDRIYEANLQYVASKIPYRDPYTYKHAAGKLLVIAGSPGYTGAAAMACKAALRSGAGVVTLVCPWEMNPIFEVKLTEVMTYPVEQTEEGSIDPDSFDEIENLSLNFDALAVGPGLSKNAATTCLVREILKKIKKPTVLDADGLRALYGPKSTGGENDPELSHVIITPHSGELASILGLGKIGLEQRLEVNRKAVEKFGVVSILKGASTLIDNSGGETFINPTGSWALATAGTGDILTGITGSLLCQGLRLTDAAVCAAYIHGMSSDIMTARTGNYSQIATDLLDGLKEVFLLIEKIKY